MDSRLCRRGPRGHVPYHGDAMTLHIRVQPQYTKKWMTAMVVAMVDMIRVHRVDILVLHRRIGRPDAIDVAVPMR